MSDVLKDAMINNLIMDQRNAILDNARESDRFARQKADLESEKNRAKRQAEENQNLALAQAGRANRTERELQEVYHRLAEAEQALVAHTLAADQAFKDLMMEFYGSYPDKEERAKNDLVKFKYRTQQILEKKGNIPTKPGPKNIQYYKSCAYDDRQIFQLNTDDFNMLITIHQSMEFWKNQPIDYFPDVALSTSSLLLYKRPGPKNIQYYKTYACDDEQISQLNSDDLSILLLIHQSLKFWKNQSADVYPDVNLSTSTLLNK